MSHCNSGSQYGLRETFRAIAIYGLQIVTKLVRHHQRLPA